MSLIGTFCVPNKSRVMTFEKVALQYGMSSNFDYYYDSKMLKMNSQFFLKTNCIIITNYIDV